VGAGIGNDLGHTPDNLRRLGRRPSLFGRSRPWAPRPNKLDSGTAPTNYTQGSDAPGKPGRAV